MSDLPIHRFNQPQTMAWISNRVLQRVMATELAKRYSGGVFISAATNKIFDVVDPWGNPRMLPRPWRTCEMWQITNKPGTPVCQCADWFYPEFGGAWKLGAKDGVHHPMCQFDRTAVPVYDRTVRHHEPEELKLNKPASRPDAWERTRQDVLNS